jgi:ribosomal protein S18 acetylase RimI-like enzyme
MGIQIRHADDRDGQFITSLIQATLRDMESVGGHEVNQDEDFWLTYAEKIVESIRKGDRLYLLAQTGSSIVGFLEGKIVTWHEVFAHRKIFHLNIVYAIPESRRQGVATSLANEALRWASRQGCQEAELNVLFNNDKAIGLYKKLGFNMFRYQLRMKLKHQLHGDGRA